MEYNDSPDYKEVLDAFLNFFLFFKLNLFSVIMFIIPLNSHKFMF